MFEIEVSLDPKNKYFDFDKINFEYFNGCAYRLCEIEYLNKAKESKEDKIQAIKPVWNISDIYNSEKVFYGKRLSGVYGFLDPRLYKESGNAFEFYNFKSPYPLKYIGKGGIQRIVNHSTPSNSKKSKADTLLQEWILEMRAVEKIEPIVVFFLMGCVGDFALDVEAQLIKCYELQENSSTGNLFYKKLKAKTLLNHRSERETEEVFEFNGYKITPKNGN